MGLPPPKVSSSQLRLEGREAKLMEEDVEASGANTELLLSSLAEMHSSKNHGM